MRKARTNQDGFGAVEIIITCLVVVVVGAAGFVVFRHNHKSTKTATTPTTTQSQSQPASSSTAQPAQPATQYLVIKEWGVQLPLSDSIKDAYYVASSTSKGFDGITNQAYVGLKSLDASGCGADGTGSALGMIFRAKPTEVDPVTNKTYPQEYSDGVTVGGYFYAYQKLTGTSCKAPQTSIDTTNAAFSNATKSTTATAN